MSESDWSWRDALFAELHGDAGDDGFAKALENVNPLRMRGRVTQTAGLLIHASGIHARLGEVCELHTPGLEPMFAEVVGFSRQTAVLTPLGSLAGLSSATEVLPTGMRIRSRLATRCLGVF